MLEMPELMLSVNRLEKRNTGNAHPINVCINVLLGSILQVSLLFGGMIGGLIIFHP